MDGVDVDLGVERSAFREVYVGEMDLAGVAGDDLGWSGESCAAESEVVG